MAEETTENSERSNTDEADDRRQFFRIDDSVHLRYQKVPVEDVHERLERLERDLDSNFTVLSSLAAISQRMAGVLHRIESRSRDLAYYLKSLDEKIDVLGRAFLMQDSDISDQPASAVNLSATGMAFHGDEAVAPGDVLELKVLLLPSFTGILTYAEVIGCDETGDPESDLRYIIRVSFSHLRDNDKDVLIRHVVQRQSVMLRKQREMREAE